VQQILHATKTRPPTTAQPSTMPSKFALDPPLVGVAVAAVFAGAAVELGKVDVNV